MFIIFIMSCISWVHLRFDCDLFAVKNRGLVAVKALSSMAKPNSQVRCENFHPITIFESTRCELASWLLR